MTTSTPISLRKWQLEDAPALAAVLNNKKIHDTVRDGLPLPYTEKDAAEFIQSVLSAEKDSQYVFAILYDNKVVGGIGSHRNDNVHRFTLNCGYYIAEEYWGKGIATEAVKQFRAYIFEHTDIIRIAAEVYANNVGSCRVLEKAGFQFEGTLRKNAVKNGEVLDMKMYAVVRE